MPFDMKLWRVAGSKLEKVVASHLDQEQRLEEWIVADPSLLGMDEMLIIGRQVSTGFGGRVDLLAVNREGNCIVLELKRGRTPRDVTAQTLEYGAFDAGVPEVMNSAHTLVVVASELDESSERIITYLSDVHRLSINAVFFSFFPDGQNEYLGRAWLKDPAETVERSESGKRAPWSGFWFVNVGEGEHRNWEDNRQYG